jgi:hypothetical protein
VIVISYTFAYKVIPEEVGLGEMLEATVDRTLARELFLIAVA